ncbi:MAG: selenocysteine-specific translation elongation factor [Candidatus Sulfotelmatobacter sp.]
MKSVIVGTAGHIDHGKTALVKALTGIDADRLEEEKRRGITIDLGFAHMELPAANGETIRVGFVDVPGHERFVRNMLAGVGGIDMVLLVIAADEGVKPQTREHFDILKLLGVPRGLTVLTKSDAVDAETLEVLRWEVEEFLRGTFLDQPDSVLTVSSLTGRGIQGLKLALAASAEEVPSRDSLAIVRLPIDRVFTMKGFGTVATGTLVSGTIRHEDELEVFPTKRRVRVRGVQVHGRSADQTVAGQRTAVNLAGVSTQDLARGMTLALPATFTTTRRVDVKLRLLPSAAHPLRNRARVHFHSYTMETVVEILLHEGKRSDASISKDAKTPPAQLLAGEEQFARIRLPEPALLLPGDRFIIRQFSPVVTIGGGIVLDAAPIPRMAGRIEFLNILSGGNAEASLLARIGRRQQNGITFSELVSETGWTKSVIEKHLAPAMQQGHVLRAGDRFIRGPAFAELQQLNIRTIEIFQKENPLVGGIAKEELRKRVGSLSDVFEAVIGSLIREKKIEIAGEIVRISGRGVALKDEEAESKLRIEAAFASAGLQVPALTDVISGLKIDRVRAQKIVTLLLREKLLIKVSDELVFHRSALEQLRQRMSAYKSKSARIDVAQFKSLTGVTRKYAIPLLEYLDRERVTKRVGDAREIL